ncbi:hypothetical protein F2P81_020924 [Scophthalmus maximus]|uniref:Uncharacterized protein n=1 Tax=Scophthalmus maximus TaxID=52904 RepID=A0A6A4RZV0_SCOMX|nr:hypothetical protein F2P81_020924 [Scophthalmus maximus]
MSGLDDEIAFYKNTNRIRLQYNYRRVDHTTVRSLSVRKSERQHSSGKSTDTLDFDATAETLMITPAEHG